MFLVTASYLLLEFTPAREQQLTRTAGRGHDRGETTGVLRVRTWATETFEAASALRKRLAELDGVRAVLREE